MFARRAQRSRPGWLPLVLALVAAGATACDPMPYIGPTSGPRLALVGDSLLALAEDEGNALFTEEGWSTSLTGLPGFSVGDSRGTIVEAVATDPQVLVVELGTNDVQRIDTGQLDLRGFAADVRATLAAAAAVPCVVWVGVETTNGVMGSTRMSTLGPSINEVIVREIARAARPAGSTFYADWAAVSTGRPELFLRKGDVHHSALGDHLYVELIDRTVHQCPGNPIRGSFEQVAGGVGSVAVAGWAADPDAVSSLVDVRLDGVSAAVVVADGERLDVAAVAPWLGSRRGFTVTVPVEAGLHEVCVVARNTGPPAADLDLGCRWIRVGSLPLDGTPLPSTSPGVLPEPVWPVGVLPSRWEMVLRP